MNVTWVFRFVQGFLGLILGLILLTVSGAGILWAVCKLLGVFFIIINMPRIFIASIGLSALWGKMELVCSVIGVVVGCIILFLPAVAQSMGLIVAGIWFLVLPLFDIIKSPNRSEQLKMELPKLILGAMIIAIGPVSAFDLVLKIIGAAILICSLVLITLAIIAIARYKEQ